MQIIGDTIAYAGVAMVIINIIYLAYAVYANDGNNSDKDKSSPNGLLEDAASGDADNQ